MKVAFVVNCRNKQRHVYAACAGALAQTYPCEVIFSDQGSTDKSLVEIQGAVMTAPRGAEHTVRTLQCPVDGPYGMAAMNAHMDWLVTQTDAEWIFQSSADDYSLPDRVGVCMHAVDENPCSAVACAMYFQEPHEDGPHGRSNIPTGYVKAGPGIQSLAYGSTIAGYKREFLLKVGSAGRHTPDVFWGYLAALEQGFYVVNDPQHVHMNHADAQNTGFQGKLRGASGEELMRLNELNHLQLFALYKACADRALQLHPDGVPNTDWIPVLETMLQQAGAWLDRRCDLMDAGITPGAL